MLQYAGNVLVYGAISPCDGDWFGAVHDSNAEDFLDAVLNVEVCTASMTHHMHNTYYLQYNIQVFHSIKHLHGEYDDSLHSTRVSQSCLLVLLNQAAPQLAFDAACSE